MAERAWEYITYARQLVTEDSLSKAFDLYALALTEDRSLIPRHESEFRSVLLRFNKVLELSNKMDMIFSNFVRALKVSPNDTNILNDCGVHLYKCGHYNEAKHYFEQVLSILPICVNAEKNLNSIKNLLVERWHFRMLNDNIRNESYRQAIKQAILTQEDKVLDVGTGTGLLALYAHEAGAIKVIGCDCSEVMCSLAEVIIRSNGSKNNKIINKMSSELSLWDMGGKCNVLVTEMFDAGLFGEHVLQMLNHAWSALLSNNATVVPNTAEFFVVGAYSEHLIGNYQLSSDSKAILNISSLNIHILTDDPYDCEDVNFLKDIVYVTEPQSVLKINFNDPKDIKETLERTVPYKVKLSAKQNGVVNVVIGWFNLYLSDLITVTTNPQAHDKANAWQHAIFFDDLPKPVDKGDSINLEFLMNGGRLTMAPSSDFCITRASPEIIRFLNDLEYMKMISSCLNVASVHLGQIAEISQVRVVDLCPFPLFGMQMLKRGAQSLLCWVGNDTDKEFIIQVFNYNQVSMEKVTIALLDDWSPDMFEDEKYHVIFSHMFDMCGDIDLRKKELTQHLKLMHLEEGGLFLPARVNIVAQLVSSHWLDLNNKLYDENVSNYKMSKFVNKFRVTQNFSINLNVLKYVPISEPVVVCSYPEGLRLEAVNVPVISDGYANAILCWYNIVLIEQMSEISTNRFHTFLDGMLFLTYSKQQLSCGNAVKIVQHKDTDGSFKLVMDLL